MQGETGEEKEKKQFKVMKYKNKKVKD